MGEDPLNDGRVLNRGDALHPPGTAKWSASRTGPQVFRNQLFLFVSLALMKEPLEPTLLWLTTFKLLRKIVLLTD